MTIRNHKLVFLGWVTLGLLAACGPWTSAEAVTLSVGVASEKSYSGGPVALELRLENPGPEAVKIDLGLDYEEHLAFRIQQPDGSRIEATDSIAHTGTGDEGVFAIGRSTLESGDVWVRRVLLNKWLQLESSGRYVVEVWLEKPLETTTGLQLEVPPAQVELDVLDDEAGLADQCGQLLEQAQVATPEVARDAAKALGHARRPVCLPALGQLLETRFKGPAITALEAIGSPEAIRLLLDALERIDCFSATSVLQALTRLRPGVAENPLLSDMDLALEKGRARVNTCLQSFELSG